MTSPTSHPITAWLSPALALGRQGPPLLRAMLAIIDARAAIRFSSRVDSACLAPPTGRRATFEIRIGTGAFADSLTGPRDLLFLLAHELTHLIRLEHRLPAEPRWALAMNLGADAVNDAWLTGPAFEGFFCPLSSLPARRPHSSPAMALLTPLPAAAAALGVDPALALDPLVGPAVSRDFFLASVEPPEGPTPEPFEPLAWARVHYALQLGGREGTMSTREASQLVYPLLAQLPHRALDTLNARHALERRLGERLGRSLGREGFGTRPLRTVAGRAGGVPETVGRDAVIPALSRFLRSLARAAHLHAPEGPSGRFCPRELGSAISPRGVAEYAAGLRATPFATAAAEQAFERPVLPLYLDASASMNLALPRLVSTLARGADGALALPVFAFSDRVAPVSADALRSGELPTSGGTCLEAVADHLLARRFSRAVILSDGEADALPPATLLRLRARGVRLGLVYPGAIGPHPLLSLSPPGWRLGLDL